MKPRVKPKHLTVVPPVKPAGWPALITLDSFEKAQLASINARMASALRFWEQILASRKLRIPQGFVYRITKSDVPGSYRATLESAKLSADAIAYLKYFQNSQFHYRKE